MTKRPALASRSQNPSGHHSIEAIAPMIRRTAGSSRRPKLSEQIASMESSVPSRCGGDTGVSRTGRDNEGMPPGQDLLRVALAQINPTVGDIRGNARKISEHTSAAREQGAALVVFPELTLSGYPPEDLLLKTSFLDQVGEALEDLAAQTRGIVALVGFPERADDVYNSAAVLADGEVAAVYRKMYLPNYGGFDEQRYFQSGSEAGIFELNGVPIGVSICEDIWEPGPPAMTEALAGAQVIVNLSASPYRAGYGHARERMLVQRAVDNLAAVVFVNTIGGQDELVFDGHSLAIDQDGRVLARCPQFEECLTLCTIDPREVASARLRDTRHRVNVRRQRRAAACPGPRAPAPRATPTPSAAAWPTCSTPTPSSTRPSAPACATTSRRTASSASCSPSPAASTPPWSRWSPPTPS